MLFTIMKPSQYNAALSTSISALRDSPPQGMERIIQIAIARQIPEARLEVPLKEVGIKQAWGEENGRVDIVTGMHGIELKVVRMPRLRATPSTALYDIGQLSSDYWRLSAAKRLMSGELIVLLYGALVRELRSKNAIYREFHNRMYVDYITSVSFGELKSQSSELRRKRQVAAIKAMGFDKPCAHRQHKVFTSDEFAMVSIDVRS